MRYLDWIGASLVLGAYVGLQCLGWPPEGVPYLLTNLLGSVALLMAASDRRLWGMVALNMVWVLLTLAKIVMVNL